MSPKIITTTFYEYASASELPENEANLVAAATEALERAYAPYSKFKVGAAVLLVNGEVVTGNNQENAAYPSGLCAERVALFYANSLYPNEKVLAIAIAAKGNHVKVEKPIPPCGGCRQVIAESEYRFASPIKLLMKGETDPILVSNSIEDLLPLVFDGKMLI